MVKTASTMTALGTSLPGFRLQDPNGAWVSSAGFEDAPALLVIFLCSHCPYVKHVQTGLVRLAADFQARGAAVVAINSNDAGAYPDDAPGRMAEVAKAMGYSFPVLVDGDQSVAKAFGASCTPDFFLYGRDRRLVYRGQMDGSRPGNDVPVTGEDLRSALDAVLGGKPVPAAQKPSIGCNIKWKPGNAPSYFAS